MSNMSKLFKSAFIVSAMTLLSRISGLFRDIVFATTLGSGVMSDVFFVAFRIPNVFRRIFAEGAFALSFVPVFAEYHNTKTDEEKKQFLNNTAGFLAVTTFSVTLLGVVFAPNIVSVIGMGFKNDPQAFMLAVEALRWTFPYLFFISLVAMSAGILNTYSRFAIPAFTSVLLNICLIIAAWFFVPHSESYGVNPSLILAFAVFLSGLVQLMFQIPFLKKQAILPKPNLVVTQYKRDAGLVKVVKLMVPSIIGASIAQVNIMINTIIATFLATGSVTWLYYSDRLVEFPLGMIGIAISSVILPSLSKEYANTESDRFSALLNWGLKLSMVVTVPSMLGLIVLSESLLVTMFQYNAFSYHDAVMSSHSLKAYALGLVALVMIKIIAPGFYARQDTKTPVKIAVCALIMNVICALILVQYLQHTGLALAVSIAAWINAILLCLILVRKKVFNPDRDWLIYILKVIIATLVMTAALYYMNQYLDANLFVETTFWEHSKLWQRVLALSTLVALGVGIYLTTIYTFGIRIRQLIADKRN